MKTPKYPYWIKGGYEAYKHYVNLFTGYLLDPKNRARMGFAETTPIGEWFKNNGLPAITAFISAYNDWSDESNRTHRAIVALRDAWDVLCPIYVRVVDILTSSPEEIVTDVDLDAMALPPRKDKTDFPAPVETHIPGYDLDVSTIRVVKFKYHDIVTGKLGKPKGQHGMEGRYLVVDVARKVEIDELVHSAFCTRSPLAISFQEHERGKILLFALRWENTRGEKGPFTDIASVMIP